jgi:hypothetical protein
MVRSLATYLWTAGSRAVTLAIPELLAPLEERGDLRVAGGGQERGEKRVAGSREEAA